MSGSVFVESIGTTFITQICKSFNAAANLRNMGNIISTALKSDDTKLKRENFEGITALS